MRLERFDQFFRWNLDPQVHHIEPVVLQNNFHQVFPDVVHVPFHGRQHHFPALRRVRLFHELFQVAHSRLHRLGGLQHLRHNQFVGVEQSSHFGHPRHQRGVDDVQRRHSFRPLSLQIRNQTVARPLNDVIPQPLVQRQFFSRRFFLLLCRAKVLRNRRDVKLIDRRFLFLALFSPILGHVTQKLGSRVIRSQILRLVLKQQILRKSPFMLWNRSEPLQLLRIHDRQVQPGFSAVVQEDRINHLARARRQPERHI